MLSLLVKEVVYQVVGVVVVKVLAKDEKAARDPQERAIRVEV